MSDPFQSERLLYRAVEDTPEDEDFLHSVQSDAWAYANSSFTILKPETKKETIEGYKKYLAETALLGVIVCLPAPAAATEEQTAEAEPKEQAVEDAKAEPSKTAPKKPRPIPIGAISLKPRGAGREQHRESYISIDIAAPYRSQGYGGEAIRWILNWGFQIAGLHRITIECFSYNGGAAKLYERLGFTPEGRKRQSLWFNGGWHDHLTFGMLEDEWRDSEREKGRKF